MRSSGSTSPPRSTGARWTKPPPLWAAVRDRARSPRETRAALAAWAVAQPLWRSAAVLAVFGAAAAGVVAAVWAGFPDGGLSAPRHAVGPVIARAALHALGPGACAGVVYAAVAPWLLDRRRARRWAAGALVGVTVLAASVVRLAWHEPDVLRASVPGVVVLGALAGVLIAVPPAGAVARARTSARVV